MLSGVTEEPLPKNTFDRIIKSVLNLSGYFGNATIHAIRRYLGKMLDGT
jgi:histone H3/H4